jgi:uncharacterized protein (TIGR02266 family)
MGDVKGTPAGGGGERTKERRASVRLPVEMWVEDITDGGVVHRRAGNLSMGGLYLDQTIPLPIGTEIRLRFTLPGDSTAVTMTGRIVSVAAEDALGMGVKFTSFDGDAEQRLQVYFARAGTPALGVSTG